MGKLKRDVAPLLERAIDSLTLAIELFNRPSELARDHAVLILLHHSFESLLKAAILEKTGSVHDPGAKYSYSFDKCLQVAQEILGMTTDERATLSILDAQRDQAQHFYVEVSEDLLYVHAQSAATLFDRILKAQFQLALADRIPTRVLPISTHPPRDITLLLDRELAEVDKLLAHGTRKSARAEARLRAVLAFVTGSRETPERPSGDEVRRAVARRRRGRDWAVIFPEVGQLRLSTDGSGIPIQMRISKDATLAVRVAKPGEPVVGTLLKQEVNVWDKFNLNLSQLAEKLGVTAPRVLALIYDLKLQENADCFHLLQKGKIKLKGYSPLALETLRAAIAEGRLDLAWEHHRSHLAGRRKHAGSGP
jgi:hypothetical protein